MKWSSDFSYVLGLITSDGNLSPDGRHINFTSKDYEQVLHFKEILSLSNKIGIKHRGTDQTKNYFCIQFGDVKFYQFLLSIGLSAKKSKILKEIEVPDKYFADFLRGCFDGDGYSYSYWDKKWPLSFRFYIGFVSASLDFLKWLKERVFVLYEIKGTIQKGGKSAYQLMFAKKSSIRLAEKLYYAKTLTFLSRKKQKIDIAMSVISQQSQEMK